MKQKCESCNSCGMPLENKEDFAMGDTSNIYCKYCVDKKGQLLSAYETILKNNAHYYQESQGLT